MKKVMLSALVAGMFMVGSVFAQTTTPATSQPVTKQQPAGATKADKTAKKHHKKGGKAAKKTDASSTGTTAPAGKK